MYLYINESLNDYTHYVGISNHLIRRLSQHNTGKVRSTKSKIPWITIYIEEHKGIKSAREREKYLKSYKGVKEKREIINQKVLMYR